MEQIRKDELLHCRVLSAGGSHGLFRTTGEHERNLKRKGSIWVSSVLT